MANTQARELIMELRGRGYSQTQIAQAIGRDSSVVAQIEHGRRGPGYGSSYVGTLREMREGGRVQTPPARRLTRSGLPARVREGAVQMKGGSVQRRRTHSAAFHDLQRAARAGKRVMITLTFREVVKGMSKLDHVEEDQVHIGSRGGESAASVLARLDRHGGDRVKAWGQLATDLANVEDVKGLQEASILILDGEA